MDFFLVASSTCQARDLLSDMLAVVLLIFFFFYHELYQENNLKICLDIYSNLDWS